MTTIACRFVGYHLLCIEHDRFAPLLGAELAVLHSPGSEMLSDTEKNECDEFCQGQGKQLLDKLKGRFWTSATFCGFIQATTKQLPNQYSTHESADCKLPVPSFFPSRLKFEMKSPHPKGLITGGVLTSFALLIARRNSSLRLASSQFWHCFTSTLCFSPYQASTFVTFSTSSS